MTHTRYMSSRAADLDRDPEPALTALRSLPAEQLDVVVARWLRCPALGALRREGSPRAAATYALSPDGGAARPDRLVRVHLRRNALQAHHVEAFLGVLCRRRIAAGVLVTTGPCAPEALRIAQALVRPAIRLLSGPDWLPELCDSGAGVRRGSRAAWLFDPQEARW